MVMEEVFDKLKLLQSVLSEKYQIEKDIEEIPRALVTQEELLSRLQRSYSEKSAEYAEAKLKQGELQRDLFASESAREHSEKAMDSIQTQREYEALDKEIRDSSEKEQHFRRELQRQEKDVSEIESDMKRDEAMIAQQEEELAEGRRDVDTRTSERREAWKELEKREEELVPGLDAEIRYKFERIIRSKQGLGIVAVKGGVCTGCHMILPAQFVNEVREAQKIVFCPYCSRVLFFQESEDGEEDFFNEAEAGGLADLDDFEDEEEDSEFEEEEEEEEKPMGSFEEE